MALGAAGMGAVLGVPAPASAATTFSCAGGAAIVTLDGANFEQIDVRNLSLQVGATSIGCPVPPTSLTVTGSNLDQFEQVSVRAETTAPGLDISIDLGNGDAQAVLVEGPADLGTVNVRSTARVQNLVDLDSVASLERLEVTLASTAPGGSDRLQTPPAPGTFAAGGDRGIIELVGTVPVSATYAGPVGSGTMTTAGGVLTFAGLDEILGTDGDDTFLGGDGPQRFFGRGGNDVLGGGLGTDVLDGGPGTDTVTYVGRTEAISASLDNTANDGAVGENDALTAIENLTGGSGDDVLTGNGNVNALDGGPGDDVIVGLDGVDTLAGGTGTDTVSYAAENAPLGIDLTAQTSNRDTISGFESVIGGPFSDLIVGDDGPNVLDGGPGADRIEARGGTDVLFTGIGPNDVVLPGIGADVIAGSVDTTLSYEDLTAGVRVSVGDGTAVVGPDTQNFGGQIRQIVGTPLPDVLIGSIGNDLLIGSNGDDRITSRGGQDNLQGGAGVDTLDYSTDTNGLVIDLGAGTVGQTFISGFENAIGGLGNDSIIGTTADNRLEGGAGTDSINGADGDDLVIGGPAVDVLSGGPGIDTLSYEGTTTPVTVVLPNTAPDTIGAFEKIIGGDAGDSLTGDAGPNDLAGGGGADTLIGLAGDDELAGGLGDDLLRPGRGAGSIDGGPGSDTVSYAVAAEVTGPLVADLRPPNASATIESQTLALTSIESVTGTDEDDTLIGNAAANTLVGGDGDDLLRPGSGGGANDGGAGLDHVDWQDLTGVGVQFTIDGGVAQLGPTTTQATTNVEQVTGSPQADALTMSDTTLRTERLRGLDGDDVLSGRAGVDDIDGGPGNDTISGGIGQDVIDPGTGTDLVTFNDPERFASSPVTVDLLTGVYGGPQDAGGDTVDAQDTEIWEGSPGADVFRGTTGPQEFRGAGGDDLFRAGGTGNQQDLGDDRYQGDAGRDHVSWEGGRTVTADLVTGVATLPAGEVDTLASIEDLTGSSGNDALRGDDQANTFNGFGGDDELRGRGGADVLDGGDGSDLMAGGTGLDVLIGGNPSFRIAPGVPGDTVDYSDESVGVSVNLQAPNSPDAQISGFENVVGSSGNDVLIGTTGPNRIAGGPGSDTIRDAPTADAEADDIDGGSGDDVLIPGQLVDRIDGGADRDRVELTSTGQAVEASLRTGVARVPRGSGSTMSLTGVEDLTGGPLGDRLEGDATANALDGAGGDDELEPLEGGGTVTGGAGTDRVTYGNLAAPTAVLVDLAAGQSTVPRSGGAVQTLVGVENATGGPGADRLVGTAGPESLLGGAGDDELVGGAAADVLGGEAGNDLLDGGTGGDVLDGGTQTTYDTVTYAGRTQPVTAESNGTATSGEMTEMDTISGVEGLVGGNAGDTLRGGFLDERFEGGPGTDVIRPGFGNDVVDGGADSDLVSYDDRTAVQPVTVAMAPPAQAGAPGEVDTLTSVERALGGAGNDTLVGNALDNTLDGGPGDDTVTGGNGLDTLIGGDGTADLVSYADEVDDVVVDLVAGTGGAAGSSQDTLSGFENVTAGPGDDVVTGDGAANRVRGGDGNDTIAGGGGPDRLEGEDDVDTVDGGGADDLVLGGDGDDVLSGGEGDDRVDGGDDGDRLVGGDGADALLGGEDDDTADYGTRTDAVGLSLDGVANDGTPGEGDQLLGVERLVGGQGDDVLRGNQADNRISGGLGDDVIDGGFGSDVLDGQTGVDTVTYETRTADQPVTITVDGTDDEGASGERDALQGFEIHRGGAGADTMTGGSGADRFEGGPGDDVLRGAGGADVLDGGVGADRLTGDDGTDTLRGGDDADVLDGGGGVDLFAAGPGDDLLRAVDGLADTVGCDAGTDTAEADGDDAITACERVLVPAVPVVARPAPDNGSDATVGRDRDGDGFPSGPDCDDSTRTISPSAVDVPGDGIDQNCDGADAPFPVTAAKVSVTFGARTPLGLRVRKLLVSGIPAGSTVVVTCTSKPRARCPFVTRSRTFTTARTSFSFRGLFGDRPLPTGTVVTVTVSDDASRGRRVTLRTLSRGPARRTDACLARGTTRTTTC